MANPAVYRAALALAVAYWASGCQPLPDDTGTLATIARLHSQHLAPIRAQLDSVIAELMPALHREYVRAMDKRVRQRKNAMNALAHANAKNPKKQGHGAINLPPARFQPVKHAAPHRNPSVDMTARQAVTAREQAATGSGKLTDTPTRLGRS
jgi:uncharacterized protein YdaU (DUF1376 family)